MLTRINGEILALGGTLKNLRSTDLCHTETLPELTTSVAQANLAAAVAVGQFVIGELVDAEGRVHLVVINRDYLAPTGEKIVFHEPISGIQEISKASGEPVACDEYDGEASTLTVNLDPGDGRLFRWQ